MIDETRTKAFVCIVTQLAKDADGKKVRLSQLIDRLVKLKWHPIQQRLLSAIINDDPTAMPTIYSNLSWPVFTHPRDSNRLVSRGKGDSYDENADDLRTEAPAVQACALAMGEEGPRALLYRYAGKLLKAITHALRELDCFQCEYRSWSYVDEEVVAESLVAAFAKDKESVGAGAPEKETETVAGFWEVKQLLSKSVREAIEAKRAVASAAVVTGLPAKGNLNNRAQPVKVSQVGIPRVRACEAAGWKFAIKGSDSSA